MLRSGSGVTHCINAGHIKREHSLDSMGIYRFVCSLNLPDFDTPGSCSQVDCTAFRVPGSRKELSLEPGPTLVDMVTTGSRRHHINKGWAWFEASI